MKPTIELHCPNPDAKHPQVLVEPGSEAEAKWRDKGYLTEAELAEARTKAKADAKAKAEAKAAAEKAKADAKEAAGTGAASDVPAPMTKAELVDAITKAEDIETLRFLADQAELDLSGKVTKVETAQAKLLEHLEN